MEVKLLFIVRDLYTRRPIRARLTLNNTRDDRDTDQILHVLDRTQNDRRLLLTGNRDLFYVLVPPVNPVDVVTWATKLFIYMLVKSKFFKVCQKECVNYGLQKKIFAPNWRKWFIKLKFWHSYISSGKNLRADTDLRWRFLWCVGYRTWGLSWRIRPSWRWRVVWCFCRSSRGPGSVRPAPV